MKRLLMVFALSLAAKGSIHYSAPLDPNMRKEWVWISVEGKLPWGEMDFIYTVPAGKKFVFLRLISQKNLLLYLNGGKILTLTGVDYGFGNYEWIEGSFVVDEGSIISMDSVSVFTLTGYLVSVCPQSDLTGDCKVNLEDLTILASEWMNGIEV